MIKDVIMREMEGQGAGAILMLRGGPRAIFELPERAAEAELASLEFAQQAGEVAAGAAREMPGRSGRDG
jgi:hypothetical protein